MDCIFCRIVRGDIPAEIVARTDDVVAFLDVQPLADGHVLVVPVAHEACVEDLEPAQADALFRAVTQLAGPVREAGRPRQRAPRDVTEGPEAEPLWGIEPQTFSLRVRRSAD